MSKPVVFVIGASGNVGTATVSILSAKYADKVEIRAGVRNPEKAEKLKALPNVTVVQATMGDSNLVGVFAGVNTLYIVTPMAENRAQLAISTAECAKQAGVKHIAVVSLPVTGRVDLIFGRQFSEIEEKVSKLGVPYTFIHLPMFMENLFLFKSTIAAEGVMYNSTDPENPLSIATVEDMGNASAAILVNAEKYTNRPVDIVSCVNTYSDITQALLEALGKEVKYVRVPYEAMREGLSAMLPEWQVNAAIEYSKLIDAEPSVAAQGDPSLYQQITGEEPTNLKKWIAANSGAFQ